MIFLAVMRLELRRLLVRPLAWVLAALTLAELAWRFVLLLGNFLGSQVRLAALPSGPGYTDMVSVPLLSSLLTGSFVPFGLTELALFMVPLLTMSTLAGERNQGTLPLLFGSGLTSSSIVLGKYLALMVWLLLWLMLTLAMPLSLAHAAHFDWGKLASASLGTLLLLATLGAIGVACSAYTTHPAIAAVAGIMMALALCILQIGAQTAGVSNGVINWIAMPTHLEPMLRGLVSTSDIAWFLLLIALALALATRRLSADKERG
ncbi:ABC transporter permease subunit [Rhodanobacter sp. L36]|uniref:ABC transporter permease n=1 Tax=Rhodanobacter sp. L36 TaxID=1747221 RepID=UPI00131C20FD|nr:ABC transporter permease subunit [Rhodanobacter sp. L36]